MSLKEPQTRQARDPVLVDLALHGGGSHGAFTWGVLDRLMDEAVAAHRGDIRHVGRCQVCIERLLAAGR
ncbi:hypothetical protein [Bradyrhizobium brasilense]|uniref:hypothetical protein n=1 Tax=Bradyrhizobium brasilense TaxID=1419277 RepID=UPI0024BF38AB|nr:hypothetical protein [Bradyrhizobium brasilense]